ncbi:MAG: hypothetical protein K8T10_13910 [Candidatus Eremiobacteraeota bacterium]|nr:hypothetical protein [Candidatus Eremiobacteraeota bacterium]
MLKYWKSIIRASEDSYNRRLDKELAALKEELEGSKPRYGPFYPEDQYGTFEDGAVEISYSNSDEGCIYITGSRKGLLEFFGELLERSGQLGSLFCDEVSLQDMFNKRDILSLTINSIPGEIWLYDSFVLESLESEEVNNGKVVFDYTEGFGVGICGIKEGLRNFASILIEKVSKQLDSNNICINEIELKGVPLLTDNSIRVYIKIIAE